MSFGGKNPNDQETATVRGHAGPGTVSRMHSLPESLKAGTCRSSSASARDLVALGVLDEATRDEDACGH